MKIKKSNATNPIAWSEYLRVIGCLRENGEWRDLLLWVLAGHTAYRVSDYCDMTWGFIYGQEAITILERKHRWMSKAARTVRLGESVLDTLEECRQHLNPNSIMTWHLFRPERGGRRVDGVRVAMTRHGVNWALKAIAKRYGITDDISSHTLRKSFALHAYEMLGSDHMALMTVSTMLGHTSTNTTLTYLGITQKKIDFVYNNLSRLGATI